MSNQASNTMYTVEDIPHLASIAVIIAKVTPAGTLTIDDITRLMVAAADVNEIMRQRYVSVPAPAPEPTQDVPAPAPVEDAKAAPVHVLDNLVPIPGDGKGEIITLVKAHINNLETHKPYLYAFRLDSTGKYQSVTGYIKYAHGGNIYTLMDGDVVWISLHVSFEQIKTIQWNIDTRVTRN